MTAEASYLHTTRTAYDAMAVKYVEHVKDIYASNPLDRALFAAYADLVRGTGPVGDLGCGPGHLTSYLHGLGLDVFGLDLSPTMVAIARQNHPELRFDEAALTDLPLEDGSLGGVFAHYSIIHTPPAQVPAVLAEFHRVLAPGGHLLLAFQGSEGPGHPVQEFDHAVTLAYRWSPDRVAELFQQAGFTETGRILRNPAENERFLHAALLARKPPLP